MTTRAEIPAAAQKEIDRLVQQDKFSEALARVDALLRSNPNDKDLLELKAQLQKSVPAAPATPATAATSTPSAAPRLNSEDRLALDTLNSIIDDIKAAKDEDSSKKLMQEFLDRSKPFVEKFPEQAGIWAMRATAAMDLDRIADGADAARHLKSLGALDSDDTQTRKVMARLSRKGWLSLDDAQIQQVKTKEANAAGAKVLARLLQGTWRHSKSQYNDDSSDETTETLIVSGGDHLEASYTVNSKTSHSRNGASMSTDTDSTTRYTIPGEATYTHNHYMQAGGVNNETHATGSGHMEMLNLRLEQDGHVLLFEARGSITTSDNSIIPLDNSYAFYYDPGWLEDGDVLALISTGDAALSNEEFHKKWIEMVKDKKILQSDLFRRQSPPPAELSEYTKSFHENDPAAHLSAGDKKRNSKDFDGAIAEYTKAIEIKPDYAFAYNDRGVAKDGKGDVDGALADYSKAIDLKPDYELAYRNRALKKRQKRDLDGALADFNKAIELKPDYAVAYAGRGDVKGRKGDFDGAIADFDKAIELAKDDSDAYAGRGDAKRVKGDLEGALADFNQAIHLNKSDHYSYYRRAGVKLDNGDLDGALADYTKAIELKPDYAVAYSNRGIAKERKGDLDGALADYTKAIELGPGVASRYCNRGDLKQTKGDLAGALADYSKAIELKPDLAAAYVGRGNVERAKDDFGGSAADYSKAIELNPKDGRTYHDLGCLQYDRHDWASALADFEKSAELTPGLDESDYSQFRLWLIRTRTGETQKANDRLLSYLAGRKTRQASDWPLTIGHFLAGQLAEADFLSAAKNSDPKVESGQMCEAYFYAGSKHILSGDKTTAQDYFQKSLDTNQKDFLEYESARAEMRFLSQK
jgi:tetratricopeptide (TPR) repeat protein